MKFDKLPPTQHAPAAESVLKKIEQQSKKAGRKPASEEEKRDQKVLLSFTKSEYNKLVELAGFEPLAQYIRRNISVLETKEGE